MKSVSFAEHAQLLWNNSCKKVCLMEVMIMSERVPFYLNGGSAVVDLSVNICKTNIDILESDGLRRCWIDL
jgi:hypothetical protein